MCILERQTQRLQAAEDMCAIKGQQTPVPQFLSLSPLSDLGNKFLSVLKVLRRPVVKKLGLICVSKAHLIINPFTTLVNILSYSEMLAASNS